MQEKNWVNEWSVFPLGFLDSIISKILTFSYTLLSVRRPSRKTTIPTYPGNSKIRFHLKGTTKNSIKTMDISSMLNTDLSNLNESSFTLQDDRLSMYNTIYIFLKFTSPIGKKTKADFQIKTEAFFQNQILGHSS